nr:hypothetical protein [Aeromicrobium sp.]
MARLWQAYAVAFFALIAVYFLLPDGLVADIGYLVIGLSCVVAILAGVAIHRPTSPTPWYLMAAGQAAWVVGDAFYTVEQHSSDPVTFPALSDVPYLASYPLAAVGVLLLIRAQHRPRDLAGLVDSLIVAAGIGLLSWAFIAHPILEHSALTGLDSIVALAYPAGDILILALLLRLMTGQSSWTPSFRLLVAAVLSILAADTGFVSALGESSYTPWLGFLWLASYVLWGTAALHPDMMNLAVPSLRTPTAFSGRRMIVLSAVMMLPVVLFLAHEALGLHVHMGTLVIGAAVLSWLVMARMACAIREIRLTTRQRDELHEDLFRRATQDEVTSLVNRPSFVRFIGSALERGVRDEEKSALIVIEVSGTGEVAQRHGHFYRDAVLSEIARRLEGAVERDDCVACIGPHQFGILIDRLGPETDLARSAQHLLAACRTAVSINGQPTSLSAYAGVAVSADGSTDPEVLLRDATLAAASARPSGHGGVEFFDASLRDELTQRNEIEAGLREALRTGQLEVYYQPILAVGAVVLNGYEALVRWNRPGHGLVPPDSFIPIAEKSDLICELDRWVLRQATGQLAAWTRADPLRCVALTVSVNVSGRNLATGSIVDDVIEALRVTGLEPAQLTLEITETVLVDVPRATAQMSALRRLGVSISIDDFGTGYTSIGQLGQLPADAIKVDRSLVSSDKEGARELLTLIVQAGHASGLLVVAEGIERPDQLATVTDLRYDSAQGYLLGRPQPASDENRPGLLLTDAQSR